MFDSRQKSTGTQYTMTVALLILAFIFSPAIVIASHPAGYAYVSFAIACSAICAVLAWTNWKKFSRLTIPSIATEYSRDLIPAKCSQVTT